VEFVKFFNKWLHLTSMIGVLGGIIFAWIALRQAVKSDDPAASQFLRPILRAFGISLGIFWIVALLTGFYNYFMVMGSVTGAYHMYAGIKMMLAILMFLLSLYMAHPGSGEATALKKRFNWLVALIALGVIVVGISAHLNLSRISGAYLKQPPGALAAPIP
jgi:uncharacterized membrane protein